MSRPRILVTLDTGAASRRGVPLATVEQKAAYGSAIAEAGGLPLWVGPTSVDLAEALADTADALVLTGGAFDLTPELYGETQRARRVDPRRPERTRFELGLLEASLRRGLPVLGVCGGMQLLAVASGGRLIQDIAEEVPGALEHEQPTSPLRAHHEVALEPGSALARLLGADTIQVNSTHHQAVRDPGRLEVMGRAPDGVIEAIGDRSARLLGVEWHPELLDDDASRVLYRHLVTLASEPTVSPERAPV